MRAMRMLTDEEIVAAYLAAPRWGVSDGVRLICESGGISRPTVGGTLIAQKIQQKFCEINGRTEPDQDEPRVLDALEVLRRMDYRPGDRVLVENFLRILGERGMWVIENPLAPMVDRYTHEPEQDALLAKFAAAGFKYDGFGSWKADMTTTELLALANTLGVRVDADRDEFERVFRIIDPSTTLARKGDDYQHLKTHLAWTRWQENRAADGEESK